MTDIEFGGEFQRLLDTYGPKAFPQERAKLIYNCVIDLDVAWFRRLVSNMIGDMRQAPLVNDFREPAKRERKRRFDEDTLKAADRWKEGNFHGLQTYLKSIGARSLKEAHDMELKIERSLRFERERKPPQGGSDVNAPAFKTTTKTGN